MTTNGLDGCHVPSCWLSLVCGSDRRAHLAAPLVPRLRILRVAPTRTPATVDAEHDAGAEARRVGCQEQEGPNEFGKLAHPAHRRAATHPIGHARFLEKGARHLRDEEVWCQR